MEYIKFKLFLFGFMISCFGCMEEKGYVYNLTDEKLVDILSDLHISESATQHLSLSYRDSMSKVYLNQILEIHEVPKEIFEPEYIELKKDPQKLVVVYDRVIKRLNDLKLKKKKDENPKGQGAKQRTKKK